MDSLIPKMGNILSQKSLNCKTRIGYGNCAQRMSIVVRLILN